MCFVCLANQGTAFTMEERDALGLHGLLPAAVETMDQHVARLMANLREFEQPLHKYVYLMRVHDTNERLFFAACLRHIDELMPIIYTPVVGAACVDYGRVFRQCPPRGVFLSLADSGRVAERLRAWPERDVRAIVFTDGERILGLGDLGAHGMGIPVGKLALYTVCAGVHPSRCLPVTLDVGTNNDALLASPTYVGTRARRGAIGEGTAYDALVDEFMHAARDVFGADCLLQFEDFGNKNAFRMLAKYRDEFLSFNDDIQGTAAVVVAGILAALPLTAAADGRARLSDHTFVFLGAGEAGVGIADLLAFAMTAEDGATLSLEEARRRIWMVDSKGLVVASRKASLRHHKLNYAHEGQASCTSLLEAVRAVKPSAIIGVSAVPSTFTAEVCAEMAANNKKPLVFALSNPTSKAECTAAFAYEHTNGTCVFASGSPFAPVAHAASGKTFVPGQGNNAYIFPGVALGLQVAGARRVTDRMLLESALSLARQVTPERLEQGCVSPPLADIRAISARIAADVAAECYRAGFADGADAPAREALVARAEALQYWPSYDANQSRL